MNKTIFKITSMVFTILVLCGLNLASNAQQNSQKNFILPKTFKINDKFLPPLEVKQEPAKDKTLSTSPAPTKVINKNSVTTSTNPKIETVKTTTTTPIVKSPKETIVKINNIKPTVLQTNPIKTSAAIKATTPVSLANLMKNYNSSYADTIKSTVLSLSDMGIVLTSCNTDNGQIIASLPSGKEIFVLIAPYKENSTTVRITPTDGNYNIPSTLVVDIFKEINSNLP